jgi:DMSO/TMAO reductase YedYZ molybdopterin-dependent catalytic subunit
VRLAPGDLAAADLGVPGCPTSSTPNEVFYRIDTALAVPQVDPSRWSLEVRGLVDRPYVLTYDELLSLPQVEADITVQCVSNEVGGDLVGTARWQGVLLRDVLARAGVRGEAEQVLSTSVDGFTAGFPVRYATDGRPALVAVAMNGVPLPLEHGFPARLVVPGPVRLRVGDQVAELAGADPLARRRRLLGPARLGQGGPVKTMSHVDVPRGDRDVEAGPVVVAGTAWAPGRGRGDRPGRGARRRRRVAGGRARRRAVGGHLAAVALDVAGHAGRAPARGARHGPARRRPDRERERHRPGRRHRLPPPRAEVV